MATKGNGVSLATFKSWGKEGVIGYKTCEINHKQVVNFVWCLVCAQNKDAVLVHPSCRGPAKKAMLSYIEGTSFVSKHTVERHLAGKAHNISLEAESAKDDDERLPIDLTVTKQPKINSILLSTSKEAYRRMMGAAYSVATTPSMPLEHFKVTNHSVHDVI